MTPKPLRSARLKAGLTPYNIGWNSLELHDELVREHEEMQKMSRKEE